MYGTKKLSWEVNQELVNRQKD